MCQAVTPYQAVTARMDAHVHTYKINMDVERGNLARKPMSPFIVPSSTVKGVRAATNDLF